MQDFQSMIDKWVKSRPFLQEVANLPKTIAQVSSNYQAPTAYELDLDAITADLRQGTPLLRGALAKVVDTTKAGELLVELTEKLSNAEVPTALQAKAQTLHQIFVQDLTIVSKVVDALLQEEYQTLASYVKDHEQADVSLLVFLAWHSISHFISVYVQELNKWLVDNDKEWKKSHCPTCGAVPSMAQLTGAKNGRQKFLSCSCCQTRWVYKRIGCPFCETEEAKHLGILAVEEEDFRIETCDSCHGYIKTYVDEGDETIALSDWSSLHLDAIGKEKGYQRKDQNTMYRI